MKKVYRHELIEIYIPAGTAATQFKIPDQPNLRNMKLMGISAYAQENTPASPISQQAVITEAEMKKVYLTLQDNSGDQFLNLSPMSNYRTIESTQATPNIERDFKSFTGQIVNWPKSFLTMSSALGNGADEVVLLSVWYLDPTKGNSTATFGNKNAKGPQKKC